MEKKRMVDPEMKLDGRQQAQLAAMVGTEGFRILMDIMEAECEKFTVSLINADASKHDEVIARHYLAKSAAQFYAAVVSRINNEVEVYAHAPKIGDRPIDMTEGLLDMDNGGN